MRLTNRYNQIYLPVIFFIFLISSIASDFLFQQVFRKELDSSITRVKRKILKYTNEEKKIPIINSFGADSIEFIKVDKPFNDTLFQTIHLSNTEFNKKHQFRRLFFPININKEIYRASITSPLEGTSNIIRIVLMISISTILFIIIISTLINRYLLSKLWMPFYKSLDSLDQFKIENPITFEYPKTNTTEFDFMIGKLTELTNSVTQSYQVLKEFTENASHEIQTPLAIIRSKLDLLIQSESLLKGNSEIAQSIYIAIEKLSKLNQSLLQIAKIENNQFDQLVTIDFKDKITKKVTQFEELWNTSGIKLRTNLEESVLIANKDLIEMLLNNLLSNATKHNLNSGSIFIDLKKNSLKIANTGANISLDSNRIYKRFYKVEQYSANNGLGLSIVKQICDISNISILYSFKDSIHEFTLTW